MAINVVESKISIGPVVLLGRLGPTIHRLDHMSRYTKQGENVEEYCVDLGDIQQGTEMGMGEYYGRTGRANGKSIFLRPFIEHHIVEENIFGGVETISGNKINSSFLRGKLRYSERNAEGSVIFMGFKLPFIKIPSLSRQALFQTNHL